MRKKERLTGREKVLRAWLLFLIASFAYEKPILNLTSFDRLNPRLFDVATITGLLILPMVFKTKVFNPVFRTYRNMIIWFGVCCVLTLLVYQFPVNMNVYVLFYYVNYLQELFVVYLAVKICYEILPIKAINILFVCIGLYLFVYAFFEYKFGVAGQVEYAPGKFIQKPAGVVWGPFGNTYFQISNYLPFVVVMIFSYASTFRGAKRMGLIGVSILAGWPLLYTGSRTGLSLLLGVVFIFILLRYKTVYALGISIVLLAFCGIVFYKFSNADEYNTISRGVSQEDEHSANSIENRVLLFEDFDMQSYAKGGAFVPYFGGGFYVAPRNNGFRVGYGFHNIYVFPFEQAGILGVVFFYLFIRASLRGLWKSKRIVKNKISYEYMFLLSVISYWVASLLIGVAGHTFWRGFATNNLNTLRILTLVIATSFYYRAKQMQRERKLSLINAAELEKESTLN